MTTARFAALALTASLAGCSVAQDADERVGLTIYSSATPGAIPVEWYRPVPASMGGGGFVRANQIPGYAMVRQERSLDLPAGRGEVSFTDVAALLEPTTVRFESLSDPDGTRVLEQSFQFDLLGIQRLLERSIDRPITVMGEPVTLLSVTNGGLLAQRDDGSIFFRQGYEDLSFSAPEGGFVTRPTLLWDLVSDTAGAHDVRISYETAGITWWADYNLVWTPEGEGNANRGTVDVGSWVSILNQSGGSYENASLKLIAGDVQRVQPGRFGGRVGDPIPVIESRAMADVSGFENQAFFEYHLYTLGRPTTIPDRSTKQIELIPSTRGVPAEKLMVFDGISNPWYRQAGSPQTGRDFYPGNTDAKVDVYLRFNNSEDDGLGIPMPAGRVRISQADPNDASLEFIGEDTIDHTPREETVTLRLGSAFDVVGERRQTNFSVNTNRKIMTETFEIKVRNRKTDDAVKVLVREHLYRWSGWEITERNNTFRRLDAQTIEFELHLLPDEEGVVTYTVEYRW